MKKIFKMIGLYIVVIIIIVVLGLVLYLNTSPQFGKSPSPKDKAEYSSLKNYKNGKFINQNPTKMDLKYMDLTKEMLKKAPNRKPIKDIPTIKMDVNDIKNLDAKTTRVTWMGHSTFLIEMQGKKILIDPMFSQSPSPNEFFGPKRYSKELPLDIDKLPFVDIVILSHDHYDHLDYESINKLKGKVGAFYTPLGVGNHLIKWGVDKEKVTQLNWWESAKIGNIKLICTPARHFSGRGILDRSTTLWSSWIIKGVKDNIYFSGDSGYDKHFKEIGDKYGPFDISLMECGQYHEDWKAIHMFPEETAQASIDLKSKLLLPMHWAGFTLALHDWTDPIERVIKKSKELNLNITTPKIGESIILGTESYPTQELWKDYISKNN